MANVLDVAAYILEKKGAMSAMKLQKLVYYSKAWHLVWDEASLFSEPIEAWANGPVVPRLYREHRGKFAVDRRTFSSGDPSLLTEAEAESVDAVLGHYGRMKAFELSDLTHREAPWNDARGDLPAGVVCSNEITEAAMAEYYDGLVGMS